MATSYAELRRSVALLLDREDANEQTAFDGTNVDQLDVFIGNAERRFYRDEVARIPPFEFRHTYTVAAGETELALPSNYFEIRYAVSTQGDNRISMERTSSDQILTTFDTASRVQIPSRIAYGSNNFLIDPPSGEVTIDLFYYGSITQLNQVTGDDVNNHWLLNRADDLIMYWAAVEGALYYALDSLQVWEAKATDIRNAIIMQDVRARNSGRTYKMGRRYRNPPQISPNIGTFG